VEHAGSEMESPSRRQSILLFGWFEMDDGDGTFHGVGHEANLIAGLHLVQPGGI
jgi:hypothetical protein